MLVCWYIVVVGMFCFWCVVVLGRRNLDVRVVVVVVVVVLIVVVISVVVVVVC